MNFGPRLKPIEKKYRPNKICYHKMGKTIGALILVEKLYTAHGEKTK